MMSAPRSGFARALLVGTALFGTLPALAAERGAAGSVVQAGLTRALPAQPLGASLDALSRVSRTRIAYAPVLVRGRAAPAVAGGLTLSEALRRVLAGSGLEARGTANGSVSIVAIAPAEGQVEHLTVIGRAERLAPSTTPLTITEPTSIIQRRFIANNIVPLASIDDIIRFQPSVWSQNPNGPGIGKAETISLRGFQDGQFNMTFDGIPFGDASDLHHTTSSLFISHFLDTVRVDRGPGTAATNGNATFGGTMTFASRTPSQQFGVTPYGTYGSFNTRAGGLEIDSGKGRLGAAVLDIQHEETDGYLTGSAERRSNLLFKDVAHLSANTVLKIVTTYSQEWQNTTQGATLADYARFGNNYGLCNNRALQCYSGYNPSTYQSDFSYVELSSRVNSWFSIDNQIYTDGFGHNYTESTDASQTSASANGVTFYSPAGKKIAVYATDVPGKTASAMFRAYGDRLNLTGHTPWGDVLLGTWADVQKDRRYSYAIDLTRGSVPVPGKNGSSYSYNINDLNTTVQPYLEFDYKPPPSSRACASACPTGSD